MGANMARRLNDRGFQVTAVYDLNRAVATSLAQEIGASASQDLSEVTASADVIITVVSDDSAMREIFARAGDNLLVKRKGKLFINCATISPEVHVEVRSWRKGWRRKAGSLHGLEYHAGARRLALFDVRRRRRGFRKAEPVLRELGIDHAFCRQSRRSGQGEGIGEHGHEHQHGGAGGRSWARRGARPRSGHVARSIFPNRRGLARFANRWRRHAKPRAQLFFFRRARGQGQRDRAANWRAEVGLDCRWRARPKEQYDRMIAEGLGELDKSGIAELTFKDRHKHSGDHVVDKTRGHSADRHSRKPDPVSLCLRAAVCHELERGAYVNFWRRRRNENDLARLCLSQAISMARDEHDAVRSGRDRPDLVPPLMVRQVVDVVVRQHHPEQLWWLASGCAGLCRAAGLNSLRILINNTFEQKVIFDLRSDLYSHIQLLPLRWFDNRATGDLMTRVLEDVNSVERVLIDGVEQGIGGCPANCHRPRRDVLLNWKLTLLALAPVPFLAGGALWYTLTAHRRYRCSGVPLRP